MNLNEVNLMGDLGITLIDGKTTANPYLGGSGIGTPTIPAPVWGGAGSAATITTNQSLHHTLLEILRSIDDDFESIPDMKVHEERILGTFGGYEHKYILYIGETKSVESEVFILPELAVKDLIKKIMVSGVTSLVENATGIKLSGL